MFAHPNGKGLGTQDAGMTSRMGDIAKSLAEAIEDHEGTLTTSENLNKRAISLSTRSEPPSSLLPSQGGSSLRPSLS